MDQIAQNFLNNLEAKGMDGFDVHYYDRGDIIIDSYTKEDLLNDEYWHTGYYLQIKFWKTDSAGNKIYYTDINQPCRTQSDYIGQCNLFCKYYDKGCKKGNQEEWDN